MITINQRPLTLTPANVDHVYTALSPLTGNTDYRYVFDIYVDTTTDNPTKISRILTSPNTSGAGIINVERIVYNYVEGNAKSEAPQFAGGSLTSTGNTAYGIISNSVGLSPSNAFITDSQYSKQYQVRDYRIMVGEQWTSGDTTVVYISTEPTIPGSTFYAVVGGTSNTEILWYAAGGNINQGSALYQGITWTLKDQTNVFRGSGTSINIDGTLIIGDISPTPDLTDYLYVTETYSGIVYLFNWQDIGENPQWVFINIFYPSEYSPALSPPAVTIWPGTALDQGSYSPTVYNNQYWGTASPSEQQDFWEVKKYRMSGQTINEQEPSLFLTTADDKLYNIYNDGILGTVTRVRRRKHHPKCPILVSYFNGLLSKNSDFDFENPLESVYLVEGPTHSGDYTGFTEYDNGIIYTGITPQQDRIKYVNTIRPDLAGGKVAVWAGTNGQLGQWDQGGYSELLEYYLEDNNCLSDPVHFLFMNRQGVWDTYTFDRKALYTNTVSRDTYSQGGIKDLPIFTQLSTDRRKVIYDQTITTVMNVSTWYLNNNDRAIVMDLFQSPEVYMMMDHNWQGKTAFENNPYLLPVNISSSSIKEFKNRYSKLVQYTFDFEYTPINEYYTQG